MTRPKPLEVVAEVRAFPHNVAFERVVLGTAILNPDLVDRLGEAFGSAFYRRDHVEVWGLLVAMRKDGVPIDNVTLPDKVGRSGTPGRFGGVAAVCELVDHAVPVASIPYYAGRIGEDYRRRKIIAACDAAATAAYGGEAGVEGIADELVAAMVEVCE